MENKTTLFIRDITNNFKASSLNDHPLLKILIGLSLVLIIVGMYPGGESIEISTTIGSIWTEKDLIATFSFPIYKEPQLYEQQKREAAHSVYPVFERREGIQQSFIDSLRNLMRELRTMVEMLQQWRKFHTKNDSITFVSKINQIGLSLTENELNLLSKLYVSEKKSSDQTLRKIEETLASMISEALRIGVIDQIKTTQMADFIALRKGTTEEILSAQKVYDVDAAIEAIQVRLKERLGENDASALAGKLVHVIFRPNIIFNEAATSRAIQIAQENVPRTIGFVQQNERIISTHDRITQDVKLKLDSYRKAKADRGADHSLWTQRLGIFFHILLIVSLYAIYLFLFRKRIFHNNAMLALIALLILMEMFFCFITLLLDVHQPIQYLIVIPAASMLLTIIFDSRVAFYGTVTMALLVAGLRGNDYSIALASLVAGALGAYTVRDIRNRTQIFRSLIFIFTGYAVTIIALALERFEGIDVVFTGLTFALANAVFSPVLTYGLLIFFERVFHVTTDLTLLELSDFNHPLLRQLSEKAPGTFHHSMTLGNLAEAAADAISANSILARVGAYFHDIGKMLKPEYFVENQVGGVNRHTRLKPRMSVLILTSHVKEGIELGQEHGLPKKILDFIPQHHGTTLISYFYDKALKQAAAKKNPKDIIREEDFRYPGPKPQSKEAAIVMLADSVEASTRSIDNMTPQILESAIEGMVKQRFVEGQLDECELTLRDLTKIKDAFLKILTGIHHQRIKYPEQEQLEVQTATQAEIPVQQSPTIVQTEPIATDTEAIGVSSSEKEHVSKNADPIP